MEKLHFSTVIDAPKEKTWRTMLDDGTYRIWTSAFSPGSYYKGNWSEGSEILFLAPGEKGESGMVSRIKTLRPYEFVSIEHLGIVEEGRKDTSSEAVRSWAGALENYTFREEDGRTEVLIEMDSTEEYRAMFQDTWPKALEKLKTLAEQGS